MKRIRSQVRPTGGILLTKLPAPDDVVVHVHTRAHGSLGIISRRDLDARINQGDVSADDVFWFPGMVEWGEVRYHPELFADLLPAPPSISGLPQLPERSPGPLPQLKPSHTIDYTNLVNPSSDAVVPPEADALVPTDTEQHYTHTITVDPALPIVQSYTAQTERDRHADHIFATLMQATFDHRDAHEFASCIDEVFLGAVIKAALDAGRSLSDISSDGTHHFLRFVHPDNASHVIFRVTHLTGNLTTSRVQGHRASVVIGYGERSADFATIWAILGEQERSGLVSPDTPGTFIIDGDVATQFVYAQVRLYLSIDDYVNADWSIDYALLREHIDACVRALRIHLHGRFGRPESSCTT